MYLVSTSGLHIMDHIPKKKKKKIKCSRIDATPGVEQCSFYLTNHPPLFTPEYLDFSGPSLMSPSLLSAWLVTITRWCFVPAFLEFTFIHHGSTHGCYNSSLDSAPHWSAQSSPYH